MLYETIKEINGIKPWVKIEINKDEHWYIYNCKYDEISNVAMKYYNKINFYDFFKKNTNNKKRLKINIETIIIESAKKHLEQKMNILWFQSLEEAEEKWYKLCIDIIDDTESKNEENELTKEILLDVFLKYEI